MAEKFYRQQMLAGKARQYIIKKVKKPLMGAIIGLGKRGSWLSMLIALIQIVRTIKRYPDPTRENCIQPNSHKLFDIEDKFFGYEDNPPHPRHPKKYPNHGREQLFRALFKLFIAEYEHDPYYRFRIDWMLEEIEKSNWRPRARIPMDCWKEFGPLPKLPKEWSAVVPMDLNDPDFFLEELWTNKT